MTTSLESTYVELWQNASKQTPDGALCRSRWGFALDVLKLLDSDGDPDAWFLWTIAFIHKHDHSVSPPGYVSRTALLRSRLSS
jgi:hypothetical protein